MYMMYLNISLGDVYNMCPLHIRRGCGSLAISCSKLTESWQPSSLAYSILVERRNNENSKGQKGNKEVWLSWAIAETRLILMLPRNRQALLAFSKVEPLTVTLFIEGGSFLSVFQGDPKRNPW